MAVADVKKEKREFCNSRAGMKSSLFEIEYERVLQCVEEGAAGVDGGRGRRRWEAEVR